LAAQRLLTAIDPEKLSGTVILVRIAHLPAFQSRSIYINPYDRKNLNRVFPGREDGTQSERIAAVISREVIARCDMHIDMHGGDGTEALFPFVGVYGGKLASKQFAMSKKIGLAFRLPLNVLYRMDSQETVDRGRSCNRQAVAAGKPTVLVEMGEKGQRDDRFVDGITNGVLNVLRTLEMLPGQPQSPLPRSTWLQGERSVVSEHTGIFYPIVKPGDKVNAGMPVARVTDYAGKLLREYSAPIEGIVMHMSFSPPVNEGETIVTIGPVVKEPEG
jgi:predicted deacylase